MFRSKLKKNKTKVQQTNKSNSGFQQHRQVAKTLKFSFQKIAQASRNIFEILLQRHKFKSNKKIMLNLC